VLYQPIKNVYFSTVIFLDKRLFGCNDFDFSCYLPYKEEKANQGKIATGLDRKYKNSCEICIGFWRFFFFNNF